MSNFIIGIILGIGALILGVGTRFVFDFLRPDNVIEEISEDVFYDQTGYDIDFSPSSKETGEPITWEKAKEDIKQIKNAIFFDESLDKDNKEEKDDN